MGRLRFYVDRTSISRRKFYLAERKPVIIFAPGRNAERNKERIRKQTNMI